MSFLLHAFFSGCFLLGLAFGANWHTVVDLQRINEILLTGQIKVLTLEELTQVRVI